MPISSEFVSYSYAPLPTGARQAFGVSSHADSPLRTFTNTRTTTADGSKVTLKHSTNVNGLQ
jgi:hypothetical protein